MNRSKYSRIALCFSLALTTLSMSAFGSAWDKKTLVTFPEPVEVPGSVLEPGRYVMKLANSASNRHIVHIMNEREDHVYATTLAIPDYRVQPADRTVLTFYETRSGTPQVLRAWFYPGDNYGQQFAYPRNRAVAIAKVAHTEVPAFDDDADMAAGTTAVARAQSPEPSAAEPAEEDAAQPEPSQAQPAPQQPATEEKRAEQPGMEAEKGRRAPERQAAESDERSREQAPASELPEGASALPAIALLGLASLGAAIKLRSVNKR